MAGAGTGDGEEESENVCRFDFDPERVSWRTEGQASEKGLEPPNTLPPPTSSGFSRCKESDGWVSTAPSTD